MMSSYIVFQRIYNKKIKFLRNKFTLGPMALFFSDRALNADIKQKKICASPYFPKYRPTKLEYIVAHISGGVIFAFLLQAISLKHRNSHHIGRHPLGLILQREGRLATQCHTMLKRYEVGMGRAGLSAPKEGLISSVLGPAFRRWVYKVDLLPERLI